MPFLFIFSFWQTNATFALAMLVGTTEKSLVVSVCTMKFLQNLKCQVSSFLKQIARQTCTNHDVGSAPSVVKKTVGIVKAARVTETHPLLISVHGTFNNQFVSSNGLTIWAHFVPAVLNPVC